MGWTQFDRAGPPGTVDPMGRRTRIANLPERVAAGVFILNSGLGKLGADQETAERVHGMASGTYPFLARVPPSRFIRLLALSEIALGAAVVYPGVGDGVAGASLTGFAGALLGMYVRTPGLRVEGSIRPSQQGTAIAKDVWLLGIGVSLSADALRHRRQERRHEHQERLAARHATISHV